MACPYTLGAWRVKDGKQAEFVEGVEGARPLLPGPAASAGSGDVVAECRDPQQFYSFGPWRSLDDIQAMRGQPETAKEIGRLVVLCEESHAGAFRLVATA